MNPRRDTLFERMDPALAHDPREAARPAQIDPSQFGAMQRALDQEKMALVLDIREEPAVVTKPASEEVPEVPVETGKHLGINEMLDKPDGSATLTERLFTDSTSIYTNLDTREISAEEATEELFGEMPETPEAETTPVETTPAEAPKQSRFAKLRAKTKERFSGLSDRYVRPAIGAVAIAAVLVVGSAVVSSRADSESARPAATVTTETPVATPIPNAETVRFYKTLQSLKEQHPNLNQQEFDQLVLGVLILAAQQNANS